jgi:hypothetical protein
MIAMSIPDRFAYCAYYHAAWYWYFGISGAVLQTNVDLLAAQGYVVTSLSTFNNGFTFSVVLAKLSGTQWSWGFGLNAAGDRV